MFFFDWFIWMLPWFLINPFVVGGLCLCLCLWLQGICGFSSLSFSSGFSSFLDAPFFSSFLVRRFNSKFSLFLLIRCFWLISVLSYSLRQFSSFFSIRVECCELNIILVFWTYFSHTLSKYKGQESQYGLFGASGDILYPYLACFWSLR